MKIAVWGNAEYTASRFVDFEWLYGKLEPSRYHIVKIVMDVRGTGNYTDYAFTADFKI